MRTTSGASGPESHAPPSEVTDRGQFKLQETPTVSASRRKRVDVVATKPPPGVEFLRQFGFVALAILLYFGVRGHTQGDIATAFENGFEILAFEARLGLDIEQWAQSLIIDNASLVQAANAIYIYGHWPVITITLVWLHRTRRSDYLLLRNAMFISGAVGLVIFATYAVAPPRLLGIGLFDTVTQRSDAYRVLQPPALVNKYAAVPSLHVGWNLLVGLFIYRASRRLLLRAVGVISPVLMAIAVVVTANHYVIDGLLGSALALAGLGAARIVTPKLVELDGRVRQLRNKPVIVDDEPIDTVVEQPPNRRRIGDRPAEQQPEPALQSGSQPGGQHPGMDDDAVQGHP